MPKTLKLEPVHGLRLQSLEKVNEFAFERVQECGLDPSTGYAAAAVAEELCTNVLEHSDARALELELDLRGETAVVVVRDDGNAFDPGDAFRAGETEFVLENRTDRRLGLYIVHQLSRSFSYRRNADGWNEVEVEILPGELLAPPPAGR